MISGCVLARNEARNIEKCLRTLKPHVDQMILIDMESQDETVALARPLVDVVLQAPLTDNFDSARNLAIDASGHDWIFYLDADERLPARTGQLVRELIQKHGNEFEAISIPFKTHFCGKWIEHSGWWPGYTMPRVLKRGAFEFSSKLHGGVDVQGREFRLPPDPDLGIEHLSYESVDHYLSKVNRYTTTEAKQMVAEGATPRWEAAVGHMAHDLWMYFELNRGDLDGQHGWILAWLSGQYRWLQHAKLIDLLPDQDAGCPRDIDDFLNVFQNQLNRLRTNRPELPLGVVWRSPIYDPSGYAEEGRTLVKALSLGERELKLDEIRWNDDRAGLSPMDRSLFRALQAAKRPEHSIAITDCIPTLVEPDPEAALNVLRTTFETDRIPGAWLECIDRFDEVWVISQHNRRAFIRSGVAPENLRVVPSCLDVDKYSTSPGRFVLPDGLEDRFVLLSIFDWQLRKGWDVLLRAYAQQFSVDDGVGLFLKVTHAHGHTRESIYHQANRALSSVGTSLEDRPDIQISDANLTSEELTALYHHVGAFVLPTRGEGWGRPFMEAMASGLAVIGTTASGNGDFMGDKNAFVVQSTEAAVPAIAAEEIPPYAGHHWFDPDEKSLRQQMQVCVDDESARDAKRLAAKEHVQKNFDLNLGQRVFESAIRQAEQRLATVQLAPPQPRAIRVVWEGEIGASHSFSNINEWLVPLVDQDPRMAVSIDRVFYNPPNDHTQSARKCLPYAGRDLPGPPEVTIRHSFPPNFSKPPGKWIHIQPWEFGHLPTQWVAPLRDAVDEIWAPSQYVKDVYTNSGVPTEKIKIIGWGVDETVFNSAAIKRILPTTKTFVFLFVGGTIGRKGIDKLLEAYESEFGPDDDVCLLIKDQGTQTYYRYGNFREQILKDQSDPAKPEIVYWDDDLTPGQLAGIYSAADCFVMPYRGEGFGLPILEAMACGTCPIVPRSGASADFTEESNSYLLDCTEVETQHDWPLAGPALELHIDVSDLRQTMRQAFENRGETRAKGEAAAIAASAWTWTRTAQQMCERIAAIAPARQAQLQPMRPPSRTQRIPQPSSPSQPSNGHALQATIRTESSDAKLPDCLARLKPFFDSLIVVEQGESTEQARSIAKEYGAKLFEESAFESEEFKNGCQWNVELSVDDWLSEDDAQSLRELVLNQPSQVSELTFNQYQGRPLKLVRTNSHAPLKK